ncbi:MAG: cyclic nucleotide-binding domain-containing protein [Verrucomicrobiota bacterium]
MATFRPFEDHRTVNALLPRISLFGGMTEEQRERFLHKFQVADFSTGEVIIDQGKQSSHVFVILSGRVDLMLSNEKASMKKREFGPGDCFGEAALLSLTNQEASFVASEPCEILGLPRTWLLTLHRDEPDVFLHLVLNLARELARKLQFTDRLLLSEYPAE